MDEFERKMYELMSTGQLDKEALICLIVIYLQLIQ